MRYTPQMAPLNHSHGEHSVPKQPSFSLKLSGTKPTAWSVISTLVSIKCQTKPSNFIEFPGSYLECKGGSSLWALASAGLQAPDGHMPHWFINEFCLNRKYRFETHMDSFQKQFQGNPWFCPCETSRIPCQFDKNLGIYHGFSRFDLHTCGRPAGDESGGWIRGQWPVGPIPQSAILRFRRSLRWKILKLWQL